MGVTRVPVEEKVGLHIGLILLAKLDAGIRRRGRYCDRRFYAAWRDEWEIELKKILPKCPSESFLRELAVFAEEHTTDSSKDFFHHQIQGGINWARSRKDSSLTSRDLVMEGDLATWQKRLILEVKEEGDDSSLSGGEDEAGTPPVAKRNVRVGPTPGNNGKFPLSSPHPQHAATAPPSSSTGSSGMPRQNPELVAPSRKKKAESEGERQVKSTKEVKIQLMNLDIQEKLGEMNETVEKGNDQQKFQDTPFIRKTLIELGGQYADKIVSRAVKDRRVTMIWEALSLGMEYR